MRSPWVTTLVVAAAAGCVIASGAVAPLERLVADACVRIAAMDPPAPPSEFPDVVLVTLDAQSLRSFPEWPWPRRLYARAVRNLDTAGVKAIGFDIDFSTPRDPASDAEFADAVRRSGKVALAAYRQVQEVRRGVEVEIASLPIPSLAEGAAAMGSVLVPVDPDGVVRRAPRASAIGGDAIVSLAEATLSVAIGPAPRTVGPETFYLDYRRADPPIRRIPIADVIEGRFDPREVAGRVVFVGATAIEFQDLWSTPLGPARPGVWIQAVAYRTLAAERAGAAVLGPVSRGAQFGLVLLLAAAAARVGTRSHARRLTGLALLAAGFAAVSLFALVHLGVLVNLVVPGGVLLLQYVLGLERVRRRFGRRLAQRDHSLTTLFRVGEVAATPGGRDALGVALGLLGDVVDASGVALLRASAEGSLDARRLEWRRKGSGAIGDTATAAEVLAAGEVRVYEGRRPGTSEGGLAVYAPLFAGDASVGVLVVERSAPDPLDATQVRTIATVGTQIALSVENLRLIEGLRATFDSSIEAIGSAVEARDGYTESHCRRLALFSTNMAGRLGLDEDEIEAIRIGALLHDVGKIGVRDEIMLKQDRFSAEEMAEMMSHAPIGHRICSAIHGLSPTTLACVRHHHERWDGSGYPDGLRGEEIPLAARIVTVVDVWDALSTARPYKPAYAQERVHVLLNKGRGSQFDPALVDLFFSVLDEDGEEMVALIDDATGEGE
ncbi:MAG: CHASE2 domain-containing protein [Myxococcales bacterium]|nr:CHASE2 domain-containing protein [Myxococcales bacterium]